MLHKAWNSKEEMPYCFPRSSIKFQGHTGQNITDFDPNWAFPDYRPVAAFKSLRFALLHHNSNFDVNFILLSSKFYSSDRYEILHMAQQLCCLVMCRILEQCYALRWSYAKTKSLSNLNYNGKNPWRNEPWTAWPTHCWQHLPVHFLGIKFLYFDQNFIKFCC